MKRLQHILLIDTLVLFSLAGQAQNLEGVGKQAPLKVSGSINGGLRFYEADGIANRNNPFVWNTGGSINLNFYGVVLPFSFIYSSQNQDFRQPFNRFGASPIYKWATVHLGYRSLEFSPYTMSGNSILGVGLDLKPGKFRFSSVYGRLRKAVEEDTLSVIRVNPSYQRMGFAVKAGYGNGNDFIDFTLFRAEDEMGSIRQPVKSSITPEDNLVWSVRAMKELAEKFIIHAEFAESALNRDTRSEATASDIRPYYNKLGGFFTPTASLQVAKAIDAGLAYKITSNLSFDLAYQRVDPNYRTLGAYFFNNDREQVSVNMSVSAFENKLQVHGGFGTTRNNLESTQSQTLQRKAGNINVSYTINPSLTVSSNYSNFYSAVNFIADPLNPQRNPEDTLNIVQVSQSAGLFLNYNKRGSGKNHNLSFNVNYQGQAPGSGSQNSQMARSGMINGNLIYRLSLTPTKTTFTLNINYNENNFSESKTIRLGPTLGASQALWKNRLRLLLNSSLFNVYAQSDLQNETFNTRFTADWRISKRQSFNTGFSMINRRNKLSASRVPSFNEYITTLGYNYHF